jgi:hypothetical protein
MRRARARGSQRDGVASRQMPAVNKETIMLKQWSFRPVVDVALKRGWIPRIAALFAAVAAICVLPSVAFGASTNHAATLRWPGYADTDLAFSDFFASSNTIVARFMPQYPRAYEGPIISGTDESGSFELGQGDYRDTLKLTKLVLRVGGQKFVYYASLNPGEWHQVALVRRNSVFNGFPLGTTFEVWLDGQKRCSGFNLYGNSCSEAHFDGFGPAAPAGNLRLGRRVASQAGTRQFYGFVDDVAVFSKALNELELQGFASKLRLDGTEPGLLRAWTFDDAKPDGSPLPASLSHPLSYKQGMSKTIVSQNRSNAADRPVLPLPHPFYSPPGLKLPFKSGQVWRVGQEWASTGSHSGYAAFSLDFMLVGPQSANKVANPHNPGDPSCGEPIYAATPGTVVWTHDTGGYDEGDVPNNDYDGTNVVLVQNSAMPYSFTTYMHVFTGSILAALKPINGELPPWGPDIPVAQGKQVATVGTRNSCHLHFGVGNSSGDKELDPINGSPALPYANYPVGFWNYRACDHQKQGVDCSLSQNWYDVGYGVPVADQYVKNP